MPAKGDGSNNFLDINQHFLNMEVATKFVMMIDITMLLMEDLEDIDSNDIR